MFAETLKYDLLGGSFDYHLRPEDTTGHVKYPKEEHFEQPTFSTYPSRVSNGNHHKYLHNDMGDKGYVTTSIEENPSVGWSNSGWSGFSKLINIIRFSFSITRAESNGSAPEKLPETIPFEPEELPEPHVCPCVDGVLVYGELSPSHSDVDGKCCHCVLAHEHCPPLTGET
jgi:hypothetical protein